MGMARKKRSFTKKFVAVAGTLIIVLLGLLAFFSSGERPRSFPEEMTKKIASDPRIPPERRALVQLHLALSDYRAQRGAYPGKLDELVPVYFTKVPLDPQTAEPFKYAVEDGRYYLGDVSKRAASTGENAKGGSPKTGSASAAGGGETAVDQEEQKALIALLNEQTPEEEFTFTSGGK